MMCIFKDLFIFMCVGVLPVYMTMSMKCLRRPEESDRSPRLELESVLGYRVGAEN